MVDQELLQAISQMMDVKLAPINQRLDGMDKRLDGMDKRLDGMDKRLDGMDKRLDGMDKRLDGIEERLDNVEESLEEVRSSTNALIRWSEKVSMAATFPLCCFAHKLRKPFTQSAKKKKRLSGPFKTS